MTRYYADLGDQTYPYTGSLPDGFYTYPPTVEEQNDPEYLLKADEVRRLAVEWDTDWFEIFTEEAIPC